MMGSSGEGLSGPGHDARPVHIIGGGPAGLAVGAELSKRAVPALILERGDGVATSWRAGYDRLHLHTARGLSGLPGFPIPRRYGRWPARDDVISYLEQYRARYSLAVHPHTEVKRIDDIRAEGGGTRWMIHTSAGEQLPADSIVVATGNNNTPYVPEWPGLDSFTGQLLHAREYRDPAPFTGRDVLIVGVGNTGTDIAVDLADGGAHRVWIAVRTPPHIVRRDVAGWPSQATGILVRHLPVPLVDWLADKQMLLSVPDLAAYGLPRPDDGLDTSIVRDRKVPVQDVGFIQAVQGGQVTPVAAVTGFEGDKVLLADGSAVSPQVVIAATGYRRGLEKIVGALDVLDERGLPKIHDGAPAAPGLYFIGYTISISGALRDIAIEARRIGSAIKHDRTRGTEKSRHGPFDRILLSRTVPSMFRMRATFGGLSPVCFPSPGRGRACVPHRSRWQDTAKSFITCPPGR
jgi:putative flavoprotein involved in K+ transport